MDKYDQLKTAIIVAMLVFVTVVHHLPIAGFFGEHIFHRELFFFPIVVAGLWYGLKASLAVSLIASIVYAHYFVSSGQHSNMSLALVILQVVGFNLMALLTGWMVDQQRRQQRERDFLNETFGKYVSRVVRDEILAGRVSLKGELKEVTVLFADIRDFTPLVETVPPREVVNIVNTYFQAMSEAITANNGLVIQFIGDEIEAVFGAPVMLENHQQFAVDAALEMRNRLSRVNLELTRQGYPPLRHGVGLHTGKVLAANIGSPHRLSYAMIGETVNMASRIEALNKDFGTDILISDAVLKGLTRDIRMTELKPIAAKGIREPLQLYSIDKWQERVEEPKSKRSPLSMSERPVGY